MGLVVCATRGGKGSQVAQQAAINRARENGDRLLFLYVVQVDEPDGFDVSLRPALREELARLGQTLLRLAKQRSRLAGVFADTLILEGDAREAILAQLRRQSAECLYLGAPARSARQTEPTNIELLAQQIQAETAVRVEVVYPPSEV